MNAHFITEHNGHSLSVYHDEPNIIGDGTRIYYAFCEQCDTEMPTEYSEIPTPEVVQKEHKVYLENEEERAGMARMEPQWGEITADNY